MANHHFKSAKKKTNLHPTTSCALIAPQTLLI
jgi:hypothetical protein